MLFGILIALNVETSFNTPPMAMACYYLEGLAPKLVELNEIFAGALPFVFLVFAAMFMFTWCPSSRPGCRRRSMTPSRHLGGCCSGR